MESRAQQSRKSQGKQNKTNEQAENTQSKRGGGKKASIKKKGASVQIDFILFVVHPVFCNHIIRSTCAFSQLCHHTKTQTLALPWNLNCAIMSWEHSRVRGVLENVRPFIPCLHFFFFFLKRRLVCAHLFHSLGHDQSTVAQ